MEEKEEMIFKKIGDVMRDIEHIGKNQKNAQQGFMYRGIDDIYNSLHPVFAKHGVFAIPTVISSKRDERATKSGGNMFFVDLDVKYTIYAEDGSFIESVVKGEAMDSGDKAYNKAMSVAYKYFLMQLLMIPTLEEKDPDAQTPPETKPKPKSVVLPFLEAEGQTYNKVVEALKGGGFSIEQVKLKYQLSVDLEEHLKTFIKK